MADEDRAHEEVYSPATSAFAAFRDLPPRGKKVLAVVVLLGFFGPPVALFVYVGEICLAFLIALVPVAVFLYCGLTRRLH